MRFAVDRLTLEVPPGMAHEETMMTFYAPLGDAPTRPNIVVHQRRVSPPDLVDAGAKVGAELVRTLQDISRIISVDLAFDDGAQGVMLEYTFATGRGSLHQIQALRLDGDVLTALIITTATELLSKEARAEFLKSITSLSKGAA
jgi:hypothetical protein